ncbi:MAG: hypothetical protein J3K34DRAFT_510530 [Monoraphidium minutum]|nr:MAG: hypothetical protein J3K34DRAFT_510530 [Monoraphidium minutum]
MRMKHIWAVQPSLETSSDEEAEQSAAEFIGSVALQVPRTLLAAWFPGAALPFDVSLQLEVDGAPWGPRFGSNINRAAGISKGMAGDMGDNTWPVAITKVARCMYLPKAMVEAWWQGGSFPLAVRVTTVVGGAARGAALQACVRMFTTRLGYIQYFLTLPADLPLAPGATIVRWRLMGPGAIEAHAEEPATESEEREGEEEVEEEEDAKEEAGQRVAPPPQLVLEEEAAPPPPPPQQQRTTRASGGYGGRGPTAGASIAMASTEDATGAAMAALGVREVAAPPASDHAALAEAATLAFGEVVHVAGALGLPGETVGAACAAVEGAFEGGPAQQHLFLGTSYRRLAMACAGGRTAEARAWVERMAARGGGGG